MVMLLGFLVAFVVFGAAPVSSGSSVPVPWRVPRLRYLW
jgi:hypothetical protein